MEKIIKVGTKVTMAKNSRWAIIHSNGEAAPWNPVGISGKVVSIHSNIRLPIFVVWENGEGNYYQDVDLKVLGQGIVNKYIVKKNHDGSVENYGVLGEETPLVDHLGQKMYVGDTVLIGFRGGATKEHPVVKNRGNYFVMGYKSATLNGETWEDVSYEKKSSYYTEPHYGNKFMAVESLEGLKVVE